MFWAVCIAIAFCALMIDAMSGKPARAGAAWLILICAAIWAIQACVSDTLRKRKERRELFQMYKQYYPDRTDAYINMRIDIGQARDDIFFEIRRRKQAAALARLKQEAPELVGVLDTWYEGIVKSDPDLKNLETYKKNAKNIKARYHF